MINKQFFEIRLENYALPRYLSATKAYYGTIEDMLNLTKILDGNYDTGIRYKQTIDAVEEYSFDNDVTHCVAGQVLPVLTPVQAICEFETQLSNPTWNYTTHTGAVYPCKAEEVYISQTLIQTGEGYERCLRGIVRGLSICHHGTNWTCPNGCMKGFPCTVTWNGQNYSMNLYTSQDHYTPNELEIAIRDTVDVSRIDLSVLVADILAEG